MAQEAAQVAPHVYKVLFENDRVRLLDVRMAPGAESAQTFKSAGPVRSLTSSRLTSLNLPSCSMTPTRGVVRPLIESAWQWMASPSDLRSAGLSMHVIPTHRIRGFFSA